MSKDQLEPRGASNGKQYEVSDAKLRAIVLSAGILVGICLVAMLLIRGIFGFFETRQERSAIATSPLLEGRQLPPEPRLQVAPEADLGTLNATADSLINRYAWIQREAGVIRIPIDRAMDLTLQRGLPTRP